MSFPRASKAQLWERIRNTQELILMDYSFNDIISSIMQSTGVCERQAKRYYSYAFKFMQEKEQQKLEIKIAYYKAKKKRLLRNMDPKELKTAAGVTAANKIINDMMKLDGVAIADTLKVIGDAENPVTLNANVKTGEIDYTNLTEKEIDKLIKLHAKAAKH